MGSLTSVVRHLGVDVEACRNAARFGSHADTFPAVRQFSCDRDRAALGIRTPTYEP